MSLFYPELFSGFFFLKACDESFPFPATTKPHMLLNRKTQKKVTVLKKFVKMK